MFGRDTANKDRELLIDGLRLKSIMDDQFLIFGRSALEAIYYEMEQHGFIFASGRSYSIDQLRTFFEMLFGEEVAMLAVNRVRKVLLK